MKTWCPQGTMYTQMEALLACGEAIVRGATVSGIHECPDCGAWHVGQRKKIYPRCPVTGKVVFTEKRAKQVVKYAMAKYEAGDSRRREIAAYLCKLKHGCHGWHVTSEEQRGTK